MNIWNQNTLSYFKKSPNFSKRCASTPVSLKPEISQAPLRKVGQENANFNNEVFSLEVVDTDANTVAKL